MEDRSRVQPLRPARRRLTRIALAAAGLAASAFAAAAPEQQFADALAQLEGGDRSAAERTLQDLATNAPEFILAQHFLDEMQQRLRPRTTPAALTQLAAEGRIRLSSELALPLDGTVPNAVLQLAATFRYLIAVDLPRARLYVLENRDGQLQLLRHHYAAFGKAGWGKQVRGDNRTPLGVYHITGWIDDAALPPLYGAGAYPLDYPNLWDRHQQRTGSGIWLHGVPNASGGRPPRSSEGCVTMANADLRALQPYIEFGRTPVVLSDDLRWLDPAAAQAEREAFAARIEAWRLAAASNDADGYLTHYAAEFRTLDGIGYDEFAERLRSEASITIAPGLQLEDLSVYRYPGSGDQLVLVEFTTPSSDGAASARIHKQLYWKLEGDGEWRIIREEQQLPRMLAQQ